MAEFSGWQLQASNKNLLINPRFKINQRGKTEYGESSQYSVDGWKIGGDWAKIIVHDDHIELRANSINGYGNIDQLFENKKNLAGKLVTMSIYARTYCDGVYLGRNSGTLILPSEDYQISTYTLIWKETGYFTFGLQAAVAPGTKIADIKAAKLELGPISTLALDLMQPYTPQDYQRELMECQRYLRVYNFGTYKSLYAGQYVNTNVAHVLIPIDTPLREKPTITYEELYLRLENSSTHNAATSILTDELDDNHVLLLVRTSESNTTSSGVFLETRGAAGKLMISAEL